MTAVAAVDGDAPPPATTADAGREARQAGGDLFAGAEATDAEGPATSIPADGVETAEAGEEGDGRRGRGRRRRGRRGNGGEAIEAGSTELNDDEAADAGEGRSDSSEEARRDPAAEAAADRPSRPRRDSSRGRRTEDPAAGGSERSQAETADDGAAPPAPERAGRGRGRSQANAEAGNGNTPVEPVAAPQVTASQVDASPVVEASPAPVATEAVAAVDDSGRFRAPTRAVSDADATEAAPPVAVPIEAAPAQPRVEPLNEAPAKVAPAPVADLSTLIESAGLQWVETRGGPTLDEVAPPPQAPRGRPRRSRKAPEAAAEPLTQIETQNPPGE